MVSDKKELKYIPDLFVTNFADFMPQRGFIVSNQRILPIVDIDTSVSFSYDIVPMEEKGKKFFFTENGPCKANVHQPYIDLNIKNDEEKKHIEYLMSCKTFIKNYKNNARWEEIDLPKEIKNNCLRINFPEGIFENKSHSYILFAKDKKSMDIKYDFRILTDTNESIKYVIKNGLDLLISVIDKKMEENKLSGRMYKTKNGLRLILTDKFIDLRDEDQKRKIVKMMKILQADIYYVRAIRSQSRYLCRLSPKIKNYKLLGEDSYQKILDEMKKSELTTMEIVNDVFPIKYDFKNITYRNENRNESLESNFGTLKNLIKKYIMTSGFAVCKFIKNYDFGVKSDNIWLKSQDNQETISEKEAINTYIKYHDKWTKAFESDAELI